MLVCLARLDYTIEVNSILGISIMTSLVLLVLVCTRLEHCTLAGRY